MVDLFIGQETNIYYRQNIRKYNDVKNTIQWEPTTMYKRSQTIFSFEYINGAS